MSRSRVHQDDEIHIGDDGSEMEDMADGSVGNVVSMPTGAVATSASNLIVNQVQAEPMTALSAVLALSKQAGPLFLRGLFLTTQMLIKSIFLARQGKQFLAALALVSAIENPLLIIFFETFGALSAEVARIKGEQESSPEKVGHALRQSWMLGLAMALICSPICFASKAIFKAVGQPESTVDDIGDFFYITFPAYLIDMFGRSLVRVMAGIGLPTSTIFFDLIEAVLDLFFTYLFVVGALGSPQLGLNGAALAYLLSAIGALVSYGGYLMCRDDIKPYNLFQSACPTFDKAVFMKLAKTGLPLGAAWAIEFIGTMIITFFVGNFLGTEALIAMQAANIFRYFTDFPVGGIGEATSVLVGESLEKKDGNQNFYAVIGVSKALLWSGTCCAVTLTHSRLMANMLLSAENETVSEDLIQSVASALEMQSIMQVLNAGLKDVITSGPATGYGKTRFSLLVSTLLFAINVSITAHATTQREQFSTVFSKQYYGYGTAAALMVLYFAHLAKGEGSVFTQMKNKLVGCAAGFFGCSTDTQQPIVRQSQNTAPATDETHVETNYGAAA